MKKSVSTALFILSNLASLAKKWETTEDELRGRVHRRIRRNAGQRFGAQASPALKKLLTPRRVSSRPLPPIDPRPALRPAEMKTFAWIQKERRAGRDPFGKVTAS